MFLLCVPVGQALEEANKRLSNNVKLQKHLRPIDTSTGLIGVAIERIAAFNNSGQFKLELMVDVVDD